MPTEVTTRTNVTHTMLNDPYFSGKKTKKIKKNGSRLPFDLLCSLRTSLLNRWDDDDSAHGDWRHGEPSGDQGSGSEGRRGRNDCHKENVL